MGKKVDVDQLVGASDIAKRLGLTKPQNVHALIRWFDDFPAPVAVIGGGIKVWEWAPVEQWARTHNRLPAD
jgi:hypothetical protein